MQPKTRPVKILFAESDSEHAKQLNEAFKGLPTSTEIHHMVDAKTVLDFLLHKDAYESVPRPDMIILGLDLTSGSAAQVIDAVKGNEDLRAIPVIVFSRSTDEIHRSDCYDRGANAYVAKPASPEEFSEVIRVLEKFWMRTARLPGLQEMNFFSTGASFS